MQALGLIETKGLVAAIEGADAMLKAADVRVIEKTMVKGGIVAITITGDVAACQASVDAAVTAIERIGGTLISKDVIPRPHESLAGVMVGSNDQAEEIQQKEPEEVPVNISEKVAVGRPFVEEYIKTNGVDKAILRLKRTRAGEIRALICNEYPELGMSEEIVLDLTKKELLGRLNDYYKGAEYEQLPVAK